jgi:hypothetical protein
MREPSTLRNAMRAMLPVAIVLVLASLPFAAIAQRIADRQGTSSTPAAAPSIITTEGSLKATIFTYRDGNLVNRYKYYVWHDGCYLTYEPIGFAPAPPAACQ